MVWQYGILVFYTISIFSYNSAGLFILKHNPHYAKNTTELVRKQGL